jgi:hypothetical protein
LDARIEMVAPGLVGPLEEAFIPATVGAAALAFREGEAPRT